jgi:hypothetical protein
MGLYIVFCCLFPDSQAENVMKRAVVQFAAVGIKRNEADYAQLYNQIRSTLAIFAGIFRVKRINVLVCFVLVAPLLSCVNGSDWVGALSPVFNTHSYSGWYRSNCTINCFAERFELTHVTRVLSFGCASGEEVQQLKARFPLARVTGTDILFDRTEVGQRMLSEAKSRFGGPDIKLEPFDRVVARRPQFDIIMINNVIYEHIDVEKFDAVVRGLYSLLAKSDAIVVFTTVLGQKEKLARFAPAGRVGPSSTNLTASSSSNGCARTQLHCAHSPPASASSKRCGKLTQMPVYAPYRKFDRSSMRTTTSQTAAAPRNRYARCRAAARG